ncbi:MAG: hypothetical protein IGS54_19385 [Elainella sp. C42_A2020_010]|nr:hypothetical protein [Elainella sp. C42_A2020_010]
MGELLSVALADAAEDELVLPELLAELSHYDGATAVERSSNDAGDVGRATDTEAVN